MDSLHHPRRQTKGGQLTSLYGGLAPKVALAPGPSGQVAQTAIAATLSR
jgi:hypothetical protein